MNLRILKPKKNNTKIYDADKTSSFWDKVDKEARYLIADTLNRILPLPNLRNKKIFNPNDDADYRTLGVEYENDYGEDLPSSEAASQGIAYEYLFLVVKSLINNLREFKCHKEEYLEKLF